MYILENARYAFLIQNLCNHIVIKVTKLGAINLVLYSILNYKILLSSTPSLLPPGYLVRADYLGVGRRRHMSADPLAESSRISHG